VEILEVNVQKNKYYKTEIGRIPLDWKVKKINEVAYVNKNSLNNNTSEDYEFFYYDLSAVNKGKVNHPCEKIKLENAPSRAKRLFKKNDILMSTVRPNLQGFAYVTFDSTDCVCSTGFAVIEGKNEFDSMYLYQNLYSHVITNQVNKLIVGSNYPAINGKDVENLKIPFPDDENERKKIASILYTWDKAIGLKEKLIEQKKEQKKGLMQKLLTGEWRFPGFDDKWNKALLGDVCTITTGNKDTQNKVEGGKYPFFVRSQTVERIDTYSFDGEAILTAGDGVGVGKVFHYINGKFDFHQRVYKLSNFKGINGYFLYCYFSQNFMRQIRKYNAKTSVDSVRMEMLTGMEVPLPPITEQNTIAEFFKTVEKEIELLEKEVNLLKRQKKGLMQLLLTGKVRVQV